MAYTITLLKKYTVAEGTMAFEFEKPPHYDFQAGQATDWTLIDPAETDDEGNARSFTIAAAPSDPNLRIATRMRDTAFKRCLNNMEIGKTISVDDPWGEFTLHEDLSVPAVFLAGGIGVTPFISLLRQAASDTRKQQLTLFYSNRRPEDAAFLDELAETRKENHHIHIVETMTEMNKSSTTWHGEESFIDKSMLERHLSDLSKPIYYIAGPPQMVAAMKKMLLESNIQEANIKLDEFQGY